MDRFDRVGRGAAYAAALVLLPYLLIKVSWVAGALLGVLPTGSGLGLGEWVALNAATVGMAATGVVLALALVRPWGLRIPAVPLLFCGWVGAGFLVAMLPYAVLSSLLWPSGGSAEESGASAPGWEEALIQTSFVGTGLCLAVALPAYLRRRWPRALGGRLGDGAVTTAGAVGRRWVFALGLALGVGWLYWAAGGTAGLAQPGDRNAEWRLITAVFALWATVGSLAAWAAARGRPGRLPRWVPTALGWLGSGSMFAWSAWKLPFTGYAAIAGRGPDSVMPENLAVAAAVHVLAVATGALLLRAVLLAPLRASMAG
ncbi:hypothetical protein [Streptomyces hoynatensis]|uniref:Uncharacterized protein n=1 Tax=Streptomyces hoynatensis TaxID=1141874 RepID=A0A3A9Z959_9ACTN|nr:hypothetical protein [Streptomyces hoynatensis]RKN43837.1 hypothetical protein D7294_08995 [Streptomyces hoynatensis]